MPPLPPHMLAAQRVGMMPGQQRVTDYTRYFKRFGSSLECGFIACKDMNYREHFHCAVPMCKGKDFAKKEEMIRHSKWHQKMDEALKYGFRRVTPMDDCSDQFQVYIKFLIMMPLEDTMVANVMAIACGHQLGIPFPRGLLSSPSPVEQTALR